MLVKCQFFAAKVGFEPTVLCLTNSRLYHLSFSANCGPVGSRNLSQSGCKPNPLLPQLRAIKLRRAESNCWYRVMSPMCYRYTTSQYVKKKEVKLSPYLFLDIFSLLKYHRRGIGLRSAPATFIPIIFLVIICII